MKKSAIIILAVFLPLFAAAQYGRQPVSLIAHAGLGWGGFPERVSATREHHSKFLQGHYLRLPVRFEYDYNRFYAVVGPYIEKGFGNMPDKYELGLVGANLELGGRFELNRYDHLRVGLLTSFGVSFDNKPILDYDENGHEIEVGKHFGMGYAELNFLLRVGYEHQF